MQGFAQSDTASTLAWQGEDASQPEVVVGGGAVVGGVVVGGAVVGGAVVVGAVVGGTSTVQPEAGG